MPLTAAAQTELRTLLRAFRAAHAGAVVPLAQGKALEAWVLMKLAQTVRRNLPSWTVTLRRGDGAPLPPGAVFALPDGGSQIQASHPTAPCFVHLASRQGSHFDMELHGSLTWCGRSGATHECDVSVVPAAIATALRTQGGGFPHGLPIAAVECKDKAGIGKLDETRQTLARMFDLALVTQPALGLPLARIFEDKTPSSWGRRMTTYVGFFARGAFGIVRAGTFQTGARRLASHYMILHHPRIYSDPFSMMGLEVNFRRALSSVTRF